MRNLSVGRVLRSGAVLFFGAQAALVLAHGDVTPQAVNTETLPQLGEEWRETNPYRGDAEAIRVGDSAYNQNCARCHGLEAISGGMTPDLRKLNDPAEYIDIEESDQWFMTRIRHGAVVDGRVYMPPFEGILSQEAMWAIRSYLDTRKLEE
ncbi:cytochrome c-550 PedF [Zhongshania sp. BJYM1]|jgi:cytochrome c-550 PedF|uniref:cytochrome c-550 PedF n=1 Tax=Zhongshania aquatica TaxID=2965069 RepID=UPI0022B3146B|nr:cytochrome c-550 PedF [Marortus sp. BJYM1]